MKNKFKILILLAVLFLSAGTFVNAAEIDFVERLYNGKGLSEFCSPEIVPDISGYSAYVYNLESGAVVYRQKQDDIIYPASTVKLMTAIVAYENIPDLNTKITASQSAVRAAQGANMAIKAGEIFTAEQLLYGVLVTGANDAANVLAEYVGGDIASFCEMMNDKAKKLGAENTFYTNPTGLHSENMVTTARDTAIIARYFYYIDDLFKMSNTTRFTVERSDTVELQRILLNRNLLISRVRSEDYYYSRAKGMSLGSTPEAGDCIVTTASDDTGLTYLCVVMNARSSEEDVNAACIDAKALLEMCVKNFAYTGVLSEKNIICEMPVRLAVDTDYVTLFPSEELKALLPINFDYSEEITIEPRVSEDYATAPVYEGEKYGEAVVKYREDIILGTVGLVAGKNVDKSNVLYFIDRAEGIILGHWFRVFTVFAVILFVLYFVASVAFGRRRRYRRRRY